MIPFITHTAAARLEGWLKGLWYDPTCIQLCRRLVTYMHAHTQSTIQNICSNRQHTIHGNKAWKPDNNSQWLQTVRCFNYKQQHYRQMDHQIQTWEDKNYLQRGERAILGPALWSILTHSSSAAFVI